MPTPRAASTSHSPRSNEATSKYDAVGVGAHFVRSQSIKPTTSTRSTCDSNRFLSSSQLSNQRVMQQSIVGIFPLLFLQKRAQKISRGRRCSPSHERGRAIPRIRSRRSPPRPRPDMTVLRVERQQQIRQVRRIAPHVVRDLIRVEPVHDLRRTRHRIRHVTRQQPAPPRGLRQRSQGDVGGVSCATFEQRPNRRAGVSTKTAKREQSRICGQRAIDRDRRGR
jgi:hypothetical protein